MSAAVNQADRQPTVNLVDIDAFLGRLEIPTEQFLEVRCVVPDTCGAQSTFCMSVRDAADASARSSGRANVYVGACPRAERSGRREAVRLVSAAWADLDFHQLDAQDRQRAERLAHERLHALGRRPTILVHTGNGLQAWWLYASPIEVTDDTATDHYEAINRGLARALGGDAVHDLARVLRVPGTLNLPDAKKRARGCVPVMARVLWVDGPNYAPNEFHDLLPAPAARQQQAMPTHRTTPPQPFQPDAEILDAFERLLDRLGSSHPLVRTWRGDRLLRDSTRSGWDMALANQLFGARVREQFIPSILRGYRMGRGVFASDDYIERTMDKARVWFGGRHGTRDTA